MSQALHAGLTGAVTSAALAAIALTAQSFANAEDAYRQENGIQSQSHTGFESKSYSAAGDGSTFGENGALGHSAVGRFLDKIGYATSHDGFCRTLFDDLLGKVPLVGGAADGALTVLTNFGPYELFYAAAEAQGTIAEYLFIGTETRPADAEHASAGTSGASFLGSATMQAAPAR